MGTGNLLADKGAEGEDNEPRKFDIYTSDSGKVVANAYPIKLI